MTSHILHCGDCLDPVTGLASLPDKSVDHVICDPPFASDIYERGGTSQHQTTTTGKSPGMILMKAGGIGSLDAVLDDSVREMARVARRWALVFVDVESVGRVREAMQRHGLRWVRAGAWVKTDPMPSFSGDRPAQGYEALCIGHAKAKGKMRWNGGGKAAVWTFGLCKSERPDHPCPKPIPLMEALVRDFTDAGETICDPFAGSGTTGAACKRLGRNFIGWEKDPKYHAIAVKRIENAREQLGLLDRIEERPAKQSEIADILAPVRAKLEGIR